jgi:hypothetical protein
MRKLIQALPGALPDALIVAGSLALSYGAGLLHPAAGFATIGVLMIAGGVIVARNAAAKPATD